LKNEPKKQISNIDLTCFEQVPAKRWNSANTIVIMGTPEAYFKLIDFFQNQIEMCKQFGSATKEIVFRTPSQFTSPLVVPTSSHGHSVNLRYFKSLKIKIDTQQTFATIIDDNGELKAHSTPEALKILIEGCQKRQTNATHGLHFLESKEYTITSQPLGDWLAVE